MVNICPDIPDKGHYNCAETAALLGISRATVMRRVKDGLWRPYHRKDNGRPYFLGRQIKSFFHYG